MRQEFTRRGWSPTELDLDKETFDGIARTLQLNEVEEMAMLRSATSFNNVVLNKGRVNIQNPLDLKIKAGRLMSLMLIQNYGLRL